MIAKDNTILTSAVQSLYTINSDELIREQCQAREDFERHERTVQRDLALQKQKLAEQEKLLEEKDAIIKSLQEKLDALTKA